ncbi:hypothetical protein [Ensifer sp. SL37]|uniref:hypothetical protein n=1 Tax=Ensifer sp. SL37 TaxID=2995137 RepID=UPI0022749128|nr:hypothetical protein [Ensifer sp. SL37]MCY1740882.1 hypothetical protein [Ensifer sp. SL37]
MPERASRFLLYVVDQALAGRASDIKAYTIATEVFGRPGSFDAQTDSIVRTEAARIREALRHYYLTAGRHDAVVISIPKGGYSPTFSQSLSADLEDVGEAASQPHRLGWRSRFSIILTIVGVVLLVVVFGSRWGMLLIGAPGQHAVDNLLPGNPELLVEPFKDLSGVGESEMIARGLTAEVLSEISRFREIVTRMERQAGESSSQGPARYRLQGEVQLEESKLRLNIRLIEAQDDAVIWAKSYSESRKVRDVLDLEASVAQDVAMTLAQPYGIIFGAAAARVAGSQPEDWDAYACTLAYYGYRTSLNRETHATAQHCLLKSVERFPTYATAWALLAMTYIDELRFRYLLKTQSVLPLGRAAQAARRAVELDPHNVRGLQAQMIVFFLFGDIDTALVLGARAYSLNPNDMELLGEYGFRLAASGQWQKGCDLVLQAVTRNPSPYGYFAMFLAVCSYMQRDYPAAERWAAISDLQNNSLFHFVRAAIFGQLSDTTAASQERHWIEQNAAELLDNVHRELAARFVLADDQAHFLDGLRKAGLPIPRAATGVQTPGRQ